MKDRSFDTGAYGILYYIIVRLTSPKREKGVIPFDKDYITRWKELIVTKTNGNPNPDTLEFLFLKWIEGEEISIDLKKLIVSLISGNEIFDDEFIFLPYGLQKGCSGIGLKNILL
jgi:hypothetical protein